MNLYHSACGGFEAARHLPEYGLHGHSFQLQVLQASVSPGTALAAELHALDYSALHQRLAQVHDAALARYLAEQLAPTASLKLRSAPYCGVSIEQGRVLSWRRFTFEAAHYLPNVPAGHQCGRMHGHSFSVVLWAELEAPNAAQQLAQHWQPLHTQLHRQCLNQLDGLPNPTSELLAQWLWQRLQPNLPQLRRVSVHETHSAGCHFDGQQHRIWKTQRFEAACTEDGQLLGHSYVVRLHLCAPLHQVLGWTVDYGDVKRLFQPLYQQLDHQRLDDLPLPQADHVSVAGWMAAQLNPVMPQLERIDLQYTAEAGLTLARAGAELALVD